MKVACSRLGFLLLTWKVERQWRQLCCLGYGGVQQEKLLLQTNNFCGGMASGGTVPCRDSAQFFWKNREDELAMASAGKIPDQRLSSTVQLCVLGVHSRRRADNEGFPLCMPDK